MEDSNIKKDFTKATKAGEREGSRLTGREGLSVWISTKLKG